MFSALNGYVCPFGFFSFFFFFFCCFFDFSFVLFFFFFQAEDGIRVHCVTGVQTCALPIWCFSPLHSVRLSSPGQHLSVFPLDFPWRAASRSCATPNNRPASLIRQTRAFSEIGRASCRERV